MNVIDATASLLHHALDVREARQRVLATNVANLDTPSYTPKDLDFQAALASAEGRAVPAGAAEVREAAHKSPGLDGNSVDVDRAMAELAENALQFAFSARVTARKLNLIRHVISDGTA